MPKAQVSVLEVEIEASASSALAALDKLEEKLNRVGSALDQIVTAAKSIKDIGNLAQSFKGISSALSAVDKAQKATAKHKNDGKVDNRDLLDRKRILQDIGKLSATRLLGMKDSQFSAFGKQLPALLPPTYRDMTKMLPALYSKMLPAVYGGKQLPAVFTGAIGDSGAAMRKMMHEISGMSFADLMGGGKRNVFEEIASGAENTERQLPAVISDTKVIDAEWREIKSSVDEASQAVENYAAKSRDSTLFGTRTRSDVKRKAADVLGERYLHDTPKTSPILEHFAADPKLAQFIETINGELGRTQHTGVKASIALKELKRMQEEAANAAKEQADGQKEARNTAEQASESVTKLGEDTKNAANKSRTAASDFKKIGAALSKLGKMLGIGGGGHGSKLFGRRGFGGFVALMAIRRALTSLIRALTSGIKEGSDNLTQYSAEYNNSISRMVSGLNYLKNAWAAAFAPIVNVVAPYVETFINILASALNAIGRFMAALTGKGFAVQAKSVWTDYAASLDKAGSSAGGAGSKMDDLKKTIMSFDEIHALNDPNSSGGGGGGGAGGGGLNPSDMFETVDLAGDPLADFAAELRKKILAGDWYGVGDAIAEKMNKIVDKFRDGEWGEKLATAINDGIQLFRGWEDKFDFDGVGEGLGNGLTKFFRNLNTIELGAAASTFISKLSHAFTVFASVTHWDEIGGKIVDGVKRFVDDPDMWFNLGTSINAAVGALLDMFIGAVETEGKGRNFGEIVIDKIIDLIEGTLNGDGKWARRLSHVAIDLARMIIDPLGSLDKIYKAVTGGDTGLWDTILGEIDTFYDNAERKTTEGTERTLDGIHSTAKTKGEAISGDIDQFYDKKIIDPLKGHNKKFKDNTIDSAKEAEKGVEYQFKPLDGNLDMKAWKPIQGHANVASGNVAAYFATAAANLQLKWQSISGWFDTNVSTPVSTTFNTLSTKIGNSFTSAKTNLQSGWGNVSNWFQTNVVDPISSVFSGLWKIGSTAATKLRDGLKSISMPTFHVSWNSTRKNILGKIVEIPWPSISFYAQGGFPSADLFAANEAGNPEMVGRIGTRTAVANNNQITEALKNAMLEGLMQYAMVMNSNNDSTPYQINLVVKTQNDEVLARAVERGNARRNARMYPAGAVR